MKYLKYPDEETVNGYIKAKEPLIIAIPFDSDKPILIRPAKIGVRQNDINKYFRIVADDESAERAFDCPQDYCGIADRQKRIIRFYNDGFSAISEVLSDIGYFSDIRIPKRYRRHFDAMGDDSTYMP